MDWLIEGVLALFAVMFGFIPAQTTAYYAPTLAEPQSAVVIFGGDMMFDRTIRTAMEEKGGDHIFSCIDGVLREADMAVANLEGPITDYPSISQYSKPRDQNNFTFTFPPSTASLLFAHNIRLVNIGNNHIANFGREGMTQTKSWLDTAGVRYFGDPQSPEAERVARTMIGGIAFSFVNWSDWTSDKTDHTVAQVKSERDAGRIVVVYTHWGEEYVSPPQRVRTLAHQFVDAGAEVVIGSHPHIVQEHEIYRGKYIYYSLGNFIFDQYWNDEVRTGLLVRAVFDTGGLRTVEEIPVWLERDRRTCVKE